MINQYIAQVAQFATFWPSVSLEIGALDGEYSRVLQRAFGLIEDAFIRAQIVPANQRSDSGPGSHLARRGRV